VRRERRVVTNPPTVVEGRTGDHCVAQLLLLNTFHAPSRDEFHAWSEKPGYDPGQRLLIKRQQHLAAHLLLTKYAVRVGDAAVPTQLVHWLATAPEFRQQGYATQLLQTAQQQMQAAGTVLGMLRTSDPKFFAKRGWAACEHITPVRLRARDVLGKLLARRQQQDWPLSVRCWRHVELPSLMRIFGQNTARGYGAWLRSEDDWRWLISRKAFDHILVAIHGRDRYDLEDTRAPLVGYAIMRGHHVVEFMTNPEYPTATEQLLSRACAELVEHERQEITVCAPPHSTVHQYLTDPLPHHPGEPLEVQMYKVIDPGAFLASQHQQLLARLDAAEIKPQIELGFEMPGQKGVLLLNKQSVQWIPGKLGRSYLSLRTSDFSRLLLGYTRFAEATVAGHIRPSTQTAAEVAQALFPQLPWWQPRWDDLISG
jgi:predicted acetyltransferase